MPLSSQNLETLIRDLQQQANSVSDIGILIRAFLKFAPIPIVMVNNDRKILLWTKEFQETFDLEGFGDLSYNDLSKVLPIFNKNNDQFIKLISQNVPSTGVVTENDKHYRFEINPWPSNGNMGGVIISFTNITLKKQVQDLLDMVPIGVYYKDKQNKCIWINKALEKFHGKPREEFIGRYWHEILDQPELLEKSYLSDLKTMEENSVQEPIEIPFENADGSLTWWKVHKTPRYDANGNIVGIAGSAEIITESKLTKDAMTLFDSMLFIRATDGSQYYNLSKNSNALIGYGISDFAYNSELLQINTVKKYEDGTFDFKTKYGKVVHMAEFTKEHDGKTYGYWRINPYGRAPSTS